MNIKHSLSKCTFLALPMQFFKKNISQMSKGQWGQLQSGQESTECTIAFVASLFSSEWRCPELALLLSNQLNTSCCSLPWTWVPSCSAHSLVIPLIICWSPPSWLRPPHLPLCSVVHRCCLAMDLILDPTLILLLASGGLLACLLVLWILRLSGNTKTQLGWCSRPSRWWNRLDKGRVWMSSFSESNSEVDFSPRWHTAMATPTLVCSCHVQIF